MDCKLEIMTLLSYLRFPTTGHFVMDPASRLPASPKAPLKNFVMSLSQSIYGQHGGARTILHFT